MPTRAFWVLAFVVTAKWRCSRARVISILVSRRPRTCARVYAKGRGLEGGKGDWRATCVWSLAESVKWWRRTVFFRSSCSPTREHATVPDSFPPSPPFLFLLRLHGDGMFGSYEEALIPGLHIVEGGQTSTGSIVAWCARLLGGASYEELDREVENVPPGAEGLVALDHFQGCRTPHTDPLSRGALVGLTLKHSRCARGTGTVRFLLVSTALEASRQPYPVTTMVPTTCRILSGDGRLVPERRRWCPLARARSC